MRLTDSILTSSDDCVDERLSTALFLGASGRFGLIPNAKSFSMSVDITGDVLEVVSLNCVGLTRGGNLIDITFDSNYTRLFDSSINITDERKDVAYLLCAVACDELVDTNDGFCQPKIGLELIEEHSLLPENMLPIGRIVYDEYCWRLDEQDFVPPCLFLSSCSKYEDLRCEFLDILKHVNVLLPKTFITEKNDALKIFWPSVQQLLITVDKEHDVMTPMQLLGNVQKFVSSFLCACVLDENINIADPEPFMNYIDAPYDFKNVYRKIKDGLQLSASISLKVENFAAVAPESKPRNIVPAPSLSKSQTHKIVKYGSVDFIITNNAPGSRVFYTTDGSLPNKNSATGTTITVQSGFNDNWHKEPPRKLTIKAISILDGVSSEIASFDVEIKKGNPFAGPEI